MNAKKSKDIELPPEIAKILDHTRPVDDVLAELREEPLHLDKEPAFAAAFHKAQFVQDVYRALNETNNNKNSLARKLGKTRQYVSRILNETANFTIESMVTISCALGRRFVLRMLSPTERLIIVKTVKMEVSKLGFRDAPRRPDIVEPDPGARDFPVPTPHIKPEKVPIYELQDLAA